jgi:lipopolysaccharide export system permease protein
MITLMDRQMIRGYFKSYFVCLTSLLSLYVVVDLFTNLDDFVHHGATLKDTVIHIISYYGYQLTKIFDRLCEAIVLLAGMFTVAWMQRCNEQLPLLSAGVSTGRIVAPVLFCSAFMLSLAVLNQELLIPRVSDRLYNERDDPDGSKETNARAQYDRNNVHIEGDRATRADKTVRKFRVLIPESVAGNTLHIEADAGRFVPELHGWELTGATPANADPIPNVLEVRDRGRYFLHTVDVDFGAMTRNPNWYLLASTEHLYGELQKPDSLRLSPMAVLFHMRLTRPLLGLLLVFLGLSVILRDQNRNVIISSGMCLLLCGVFFGASYTCKMLGDGDYLDPTLAAWTPVLFFGPLAVALFDAIHT